MIGFKGVGERGLDRGCHCDNGRIWFLLGLMKCVHGIRWLIGTQG